MAMLVGSASGNIFYTLLHDLISCPSRLSSLMFALPADGLLLIINTSLNAAQRAWHSLECDYKEPTACVVLPPPPITIRDSPLAVPRALWAKGGECLHRLHTRRGWWGPRGRSQWKQIKRRGRERERERERERVRDSSSRGRHLCNGSS